MTIRLLLADDQALVRGALSALLSLESDLEVVAEVGVGRRWWCRPCSSTVPTSPCSTSRCPGSTASAPPPRYAGSPRSTRVLIVTTFGRPGFLRRAMQAGASGFVVKDTPAAQLADAVRRVHQGLRVVDPALAMDSLVVGDSPSPSGRPRCSGPAPTAPRWRPSRSGCTCPRAPSATTSRRRSARPAPANRSEAVLIATANGWL